MTSRARTIKGSICALIVICLMLDQRSVVSKLGIFTVGNDKLYYPATSSDSNGKPDMILDEPKQAEVKKEEPKPPEPEMKKEEPKKTEVKKEEPIQPAPVKDERPLDLSIPERMPWNTIDVNDTFWEQGLGKATIEMFKGQWVEIKEGEPYFERDHHTCPVTGQEFAGGGYGCVNATGYIGGPEDVVIKGYPRIPKRYVANGLRPFNASQFLNFFKDKGPLYFIGDSLCGQFNHALQCMIEEQLGPPKQKMSEWWWKPVFTLTPKRMQQIEPRVVAPELPVTIFYDPENTWVDDLIKANATYFVFNSGTWWVNNFRLRLEWCHWKKWKKIDYKTVIEIYEETHRLMVLPQLKKLKRHGITAIWRDVPPGGMWDKNGNVVPGQENIYLNDYQLHPVFNRIGRRITQEAGGLILPIYDLSMLRSDDHLATSDQLHWCRDYSPYTVPSTWVQLLQAVLFDENGEAVDQKYTFDEDIDEGKSQNVDVATPYSWEDSKTSPCKCSDAHYFIRCFANSRCEWIKTEKYEYCRDKGAVNDDSDDDESSED